MRITPALLVELCTFTVTVHWPAAMLSASESQ
jgi:hypothetical protein